MIQLSLNEIPRIVKKSAQLHASVTDMLIPICSSMLPASYFVPLVCGDEVVIKEAHYRLSIILFHGYDITRNGPVRKLTISLILPLNYLFAAIPYVGMSKKVI